MCGKISNVPVYPENFITTNGRKAIEKELTFLPHHSKRREELKKLLNFPVIKTTEQNSVVLPGNGVKLRFSNNDSFFCVIDGTHEVKSHVLPEKAKIVLASSELGKALLGKKLKEEGIIKKEAKNFVIEEIIPPKKAKWVFRLSGLNVE